MKLEVCIENLETAKVANRLGCDRVELCSALSVGGLTPSFGLISECVTQTDLEVHVMIRHQGGNFILSNDNLKIALSDVEMAKKAGAKGIVFGCLTKESTIDVDKLKVVIDFAKSEQLEVTFHRAFDFVPDPMVSLDELIDLGVDRLLTSGQQPKAIEGINLISKLVEHSNECIQIMAGSGINFNNASILANTGIDALHFTAYLRNENYNEFGMGSKSIPDEVKIQSIINSLK